MSERLYDVRFYAHCGMVFDVADGVERDEAQRIVKARNSLKRKQGHVVAKVDKNAWEVQERDDAMMIGDDIGILVVMRHSEPAGRRRR